MQILDPLVLRRDFSSRDCHKVIVFFLLKGFMGNQFMPLQEEAIRFFNILSDDFFQNWDDYDKTLKNAFQIIFFIFLTFLYAKELKEDFQDSYNERVLQKYIFLLLVLNIF